MFLNNQNKIAIVLQNLVDDLYFLNPIKGKVTFFDLKNYVIKKCDAQKVSNVDFVVKNFCIKNYCDSLLKVYSKYKDPDNILYIYYRTS